MCQKEAIKASKNIAELKKEICEHEEYKKDFRERSDNAIARNVQMSIDAAKQVQALKDEIECMKESPCWNEEGWDMEERDELIENLECSEAKYKTLEKDYGDFLSSLADKKDKSITEDDHRVWRVDVDTGEVHDITEEDALADKKEKYVFSTADPHEQDKSAKESDRRHIVGLTIDNSEED